MAHYFNYDFGKHKHRIMALPTSNENGEIIGFRPVVLRCDANNGGVVEQVSDNYPGIKWKIFSNERLCRDFAIDFFNSLEART